jgi:hypothetical protein
MLDLLAAISSVDPPALLAWLVFLFAASGYPLGIMLGSSCSPCCGTPCSQCTQGALPKTITVSLEGYADDQVPGPDLAGLSFSSNFGAGAAGKVTAPAGTPAPISEVEVTNGGSGYARISRFAPTVTAEVSGGTGAEIEVTLEEIEYEGRPAWRVDSLSVTDGGTGYPATGSITFDIESGDTEITSASGAFACSRVTPSVSLAVNGNGSGASLTASLTYYTEDFWYVSGVTVVSGGSGYTAGDSVDLTITDGESAGVPFAMTVTVDASGSVTGVSVDNPFPYYPPWNRGSYFKNSGIIITAEVYSGGVYYRDDASIPGETATVTIGVEQYGPPAATAAGAVLLAVIDDDPDSETFGQITGVTIDDGGDGYVAWLYRAPQCCEDFWNGMTVVLRQSESDPCVYEKPICGAGFDQAGFCNSGITVRYSGPLEYPRVTGGGSGMCYFDFAGQTLVENCDDFSFVAGDPDGFMATVTAGGTFDLGDKYEDSDVGACFPCCRGEETPLEDVEVEVAHWDAEEEIWVSPADPENAEASLPVVVLQRHPPFGYPDIGCRSTWSAETEFGYDLSAYVEECGDALAIDCDHCPRKCQTIASITNGGGPCVSWKYDPIVLQGGPAFRASCDCVDRPVCAPSTGQYVVDTYGPGTIWQINTPCNTPFGAALKVRVTVL